jgi:outer membrane immunogenic protein
MKKFLVAVISSLALTGSTSAADLIPEFQSPPVVVYNWSGFYTGVHIGSAWGTKTWFDRNDLSDDVSYSTNGVLGGLQAGWNYQTGVIVFGLDGDFAWTNARGSGNLLFTPPLRGTVTTNMNWIATITGRIGVANDKALYYLKGGLALSGEEHRFAQFAGGGGVALTQTVRDNRGGFVLGFGGEFAVWQNWTAKLEYNYMDFGKKTVVFPALQAASGTTIDQQVHVVKLGLNYLFH